MCKRSAACPVDTTLKRGHEARLQHEKKEDRPAQNNPKRRPRQRARGAGIHATQGTSYCVKHVIVNRPNVRPLH